MEEQLKKYIITLKRQISTLQTKLKREQRRVHELEQQLSRKR